MAPVSTIKEVFFPATTPSTLSSKLVFGTWAGGWNPGPIIGTTLVVLGWGSGEKWGFPQRHQGVPVGIPLSRSGRWGPLQGHQGAPGDSPSSSVPIGHRLGMLLWGPAGLGMPLPSVLTGCIGSSVRWWGRRGGGGLKPHSGMTWARLISFFNCCRQKGIFSFSLVFFFSLSLLFIIEHLEGYF